jgi:type IV pilus assembly protein PilC
MPYQYIAYNTKGVMVKGKLHAANDKAATDLLNMAGYQVINLKPFVPFFDMEKWAGSIYQVKTPDIVLLYRQLAMLLECGTNIGASMEMLQEQSSNPLLRSVLKGVVTEIRGGSQLSAALSRYPKIFRPEYCQLLGVGEESGNLEGLLRQVADYLEKQELTNKQIKGALLMPSIISVLALVVVGLMVTFVLPSFGKMYESLGAELPALAKFMIGLGEGARNNGLIVLTLIGAVAGGLTFYIKTPRGRYSWDRLLLDIPLLGRVRLLSELARYCRSMALLFHAGMPLSEVLPLVIKGSGNKYLAEAMMNVHGEMVKGAGLSGPMSKNKIFLPMMVQMVKVGEETGSLDTTLQAVAQSYEAEASDKVRSIIGLIEPVMTIGIGGIIGLIAVTLMSAMTSMYGTF